MVSLQPPPDSSSGHLPDVQTDEEWIEQLKQFDSAAWDRLLHRYQIELWEYSSYRLLKAGIAHDDKICDDIVSATWLTAVEKIHSFQWMGEAGLKWWLRNIAQNHILKLRRKNFQQRSQSFEAFEDDKELDNFLGESGLYNDSAESEAERRERAIALDTALRELNARDREIFMRRMVNRESPADLAAEYGMNVQAVYKLVDRAKKNVYLQMIMRGFFRKSSQ
ncbi:MAG: sigma-70 family RNA polymerase sigma factor [Anaerolineae bacterium]|nr:sigma-70 family RNA polymerase sigma factor [Anaerolineae bacterium]